MMIGGDGWSCYVGRCENDGRRDDGTERGSELGKTYSPLRMDVGMSVVGSED